MAQVDGRPAEGITRGRRVPNFALPTPEGLTLLFYEYTSGRPMLLAATASSWSADENARFIDAVRTCASRRELQSVILVGDSPGPSAAEGVVVDAEGDVRRRVFGAGIDGADGGLIVTDRNLRAIDGAGVDRAALGTEALATGIDALIEASLKELEAEDRQSLGTAPVLVVPRVLSAELCRSLIEQFAQWNTTPSPMPTADGLAVDPQRKARIDAMIEAPDLERGLLASIAEQVFPEITKAFHYRPTRFERLKMVCYRAADGGHFGAHRDNTAPTTAHRRFALTLNLNAGAYEGGALEFPEYGVDCTYDVPTGAAIVFSCNHAHRVRPVTSGERYALISFTFGEEAVAAARTGAVPAADGA